MGGKVEDEAGARGQRSDSQSQSVNFVLRVWESLGV